MCYLQWPVPCDRMAIRMTLSNENEDCDIVVTYNVNGRNSDVSPETHPRKGLSHVFFKYFRRITNTSAVIEVGTMWYVEMELWLTKALTTLCEVLWSNYRERKHLQAWRPRRGGPRLLLGIAVEKSLCTFWRQDVKGEYIHTQIFTLPMTNIYKGYEVIKRWYFYVPVFHAANWVAVR